MHRAYQQIMLVLLPHSKRTLKAGIKQLFNFFYDQNVEVTVEIYFTLFFYFIILL